MRLAFLVVSGLMRPPQTSVSSPGDGLWVCLPTVRLHYSNPQPNEVVDFRFDGVKREKRIVCASAPLPILPHIMQESNRIRVGTFPEAMLEF